MAASKIVGKSPIARSSVPRRLLRPKLSRSQFLACTCSSPVGVIGGSGGSSQSCCLVKCISEQPLFTIFDMSAGLYKLDNLSLVRSIEVDTVSVPVAWTESVQHAAPDKTSIAAMGQTIVSHIHLCAPFRRGDCFHRPPWCQPSNHAFHCAFESQHCSLQELGHQGHRRIQCRRQLARRDCTW